MRHSLRTARTSLVLGAAVNQDAEPWSSYEETEGDVYMVEKPKAPVQLKDGVRRHTISVYVADERGMINRVAGVFARRGFNIESLAVGLWGARQDRALFTVVVLGEDRNMKALVKQIYRLPNVRKVLLLTSVPRVERGLVLMKVKITPETRTEVLELVQIFRASVVDVSEGSIILCATGDPGKGIALQRALSKYGIIQIARTGKVSLRRELPLERLRSQLRKERSVDFDPEDSESRSSMSPDLSAAELLAERTGGSMEFPDEDMEMSWAPQLEEPGVYRASAMVDWMGIWDDADAFDEADLSVSPGLLPHTLSIVVDNMAGVLNSVTGVVARRGYNVQSLAVGPAEKRGVSRITMVVPGTVASIDALLRQLRKLVSVLEASDITSTPFVERELMMIKVIADSMTRSEVIEIANVFRAKVRDISNETVVLEVVGKKEKMKAIIQMLDKFGVAEVARTGLVALSRDGGVDTRILEQFEMDFFF